MGNPGIVRARRRYREKGLCSRPANDHTPRAGRSQGVAGPSRRAPAFMTPRRRPPMHAARVPLPSSGDQLPLYIVVSCAGLDAPAPPSQRPRQPRQTVRARPHEGYPTDRVSHPQTTHKLSTGYSSQAALQCLKQRTILYPHCSPPTRYWVEAKNRTQEERIAQAPFAGFSRSFRQQFRSTPGLAWVTATKHLLQVLREPVRQRAESPADHYM